MVRITETDEQKENSHHRYTGAVRVDFPRGVATVDVDDDVAQEAVASYETVEFAEDVEANAEAEADDGPRDAAVERSAEPESGMERQSTHDAAGRTEGNEPERERTPAHIENSDAEGASDVDEDDREPEPP